MPLRDAVKDVGVAPADLGSDPALLERIGHVVELHVEQGRHMADLGAPVGLCERILPHGRWRLTLSGDWRGARVPSGMLFVRTPIGVSHSPREHATPQNCLQGVLALAAALEELAS